MKEFAVFLGATLLALGLIFGLASWADSYDDRQRAKMIERCEKAQGIVKGDAEGYIFCEINGVRVAEY